MAAILASPASMVLPEWGGLLETPERLPLYWQLLQSRAARLRPPVRLVPARYATVPVYYVLPSDSGPRAIIMTPQRNCDDWLAAAFLAEWHASYWASGGARRDAAPVTVPFPGDAWRNQDVTFWSPLFAAPLAW